MVYNTHTHTVSGQRQAIPNVPSLLPAPLPPLPPSDLYFGLRRGSLQVKVGVANHILHPEAPLSTTSDMLWPLCIPDIPKSRSDSGTEGMF